MVGSRTKFEREFQTAGQQLKRPNGCKCWASSEVLQVVDGTQVPLSVSTGGWNAVVRQVRRCRHPWTVIASLKNPGRRRWASGVRHAGHGQFPSAGDDTRSSVQLQHTLHLVRYCPWCTSKNSVAVINPWIYNGIDECS